MNRSEICQAADKTISRDRQLSYGEPESNFAKIAEFWEVYLGVKLDAHDVAMMMGLMKIARIMGGTKLDNYVDLAGYAACAGEIASKGIK